MQDNVLMWKTYIKNHQTLELNAHLHRISNTAP